MAMQVAMTEVWRRGLVTVSDMFAIVIIQSFNLKTKVVIVRDRFCSLLLLLKAE